jgi:hypothetical protein
MRTRTCACYMFTCTCACACACACPSLVPFRVFLPASCTPSTFSSARYSYCPRSCAAWTAATSSCRTGGSTRMLPYTHLTALRPPPSQRAVQQTRRQGQTDRQRRRGQRRQHRVLALSRGAYPHPIPPVTRPRAPAPPSQLDTCLGSFHSHTEHSEAVSVLELYYPLVRTKEGGLAGARAAGAAVRTVRGACTRHAGLQRARRGGAHLTHWHATVWRRVN